MAEAGVSLVPISSTLNLAGSVARRGQSLATGAMQLTGVDGMVESLQRAGGDFLEQAGLTEREAYSDSESDDELDHMGNFHHLHDHHRSEDDDDDDDDDDGDRCNLARQAPPQPTLTLVGLRLT